MCQGMLQLPKSRLVHIAAWFALLLVVSVLFYRKQPYNASNSGGVASVQHHYQIGHPTWLEVHDVTVSIPEYGQGPSTTQTVNTSFSLLNLTLSLAAIAVFSWLLSFASSGFTSSRQVRTSART